MNLKHITYCRACSNQNLTTALDLGKMYLQGCFSKPGDISPPRRKVSNRLVRCDTTKCESGCGLVQTAISVPPEILYSNYWYRSGVSDTMKDHLRSITARTVEFAGPAGKVLDIASNDGTTLSFYPESYKKYGIDPSNITLETKKKYPKFSLLKECFPLDYNNPNYNKLQQLKFNIISSIAVFYDIEKPIEFCEEIVSILDSNGAWVFEVAYLPTMIQNLSYDSVVAEHIEHYSLSSLEYILNSAKLRIISAEKTTTNGGSILIFATHKSNNTLKSKTNQIDLLRRAEFEMKLDEQETYHDFSNRVKEHNQLLNNAVFSLKQKGAKIVAYGASTKGNTLIEACKLDTLIDFAAERSPEKFGAETLHGIKILSEEDAREKMKAGDCFILFPYHFARECLAREKDLIEAGIKFLIPLPEIKIVDKDNYKEFIK